MYIYMYMDGSFTGKGMAWCHKRLPLSGFEDGVPPSPADDTPPWFMVPNRWFPPHPPWFRDIFKGLNVGLNLTQTKETEDCGHHLHVPQKLEPSWAMLGHSCTIILSHITLKLTVILRFNLDFVGVQQWQRQTSRIFEAIPRSASVKREPPKPDGEPCTNPIQTLRLGPQVEICFQPRIANIDENMNLY